MSGSMIIWAKRFMGFDYNRKVSFKEIREKYGNRIIFQGTRGEKIPGARLKEVSKKGFYEGIFEFEPLPEH